MFARGMCRCWPDQAILDARQLEAANFLLKLRINVRVASSNFDCFGGYGLYLVKGKPV